MVELRTDDAEHPIPLELRAIFRSIASAFCSGDFALQSHTIASVNPIDPGTARHIRENVEDYGDALAELNEATWEHSCYRWEGSFWSALVDLSPSNEKVSDLVLHAKIRLEPALRIQVETVHVP